jgi:lambda repressor-like predicted transcriptional regulator
MDDQPTATGKPEETRATRYKLIREVEEALDKSPGSRKLIAQLKDAHRINESVKAQRQKRTMENVLGRPNYKENDLIISSFGKHPFELKRPSQVGQINESTGKKVTMTMSERAAQPSTAKFADDPVPYGAPPHPSQPTPITEAKLRACLSQMDLTDAHDQRFRRQRSLALPPAR